MVINENVSKKIIPIAGGKGGVGKTIITANLAIELAKNGKNVVVIDLDLGGSNLHTYLGMKNTKLGIGNFLTGRGVSFQDILHETPFENLSFVPGDVLVSGVTDVQFARKRKLIDSFLNINADYILLDLGSGCSSNVIDFFLISNSGFVVTTGQTASVLNAYGFLKNVVYRFFQRAFASHKEISKYLKKSLKEKKPGTSLAVSAIIKNIEEIDTSEGEKARKYVSVLKPKLIVNMAESPDELVIIEKLRDLVKSTLDLDVELMGLVYADNSIDESLEERLPLVIYKNDTMAARDIARIALKIIHSDRFPDMPLALDYYKDTFELTQIEAHNDFEELESLRKNEEELNLEELLTIISAQEKQINELRGTIRMLTMRSR